MQEKKVIQEGKAVLNEMNAALLEIEDLPLKKNCPSWNETTRGSRNCSSDYFK